MHEARILKGCNCTKICSKLKMKCIQLTHLSLVFQHMDWLVILLRDNSHLSDRENINFMHPLTKMMIEKAFGALNRDLDVFCIIHVDLIDLPIGGQ